MAPSRRERTPRGGAEPSVRIRGAIKAYGDRRALDGLDLELRAGEWTGLIGPNGAGKTTCMMAIAGLVPLDAGEVEVEGRNLRGPRAKAVGWVPQDLALYTQLSGLENLRTFGTFHGVRGAQRRRRIEWALEWTGLAARAKDRVATYSGGMQRRLNIACAVLHRPRTLLLDEPTVGVDPQARERIFSMLGQLKDDGVALLHSSHELGDIESSCDRLIILDRGRELASGTVSEIIRSTVGEGARLKLQLTGVGGLDAIESALATSAPGLRRGAGGHFEADLDNVVTDLPALLSGVSDAGAEISGLDLRTPGLQDVFLQLTGRGLRE
ncbi:MAG: ABC transporter ATP-binding protein [Acidobacteriota bacterium]